MSMSPVWATQQDPASRNKQQKQKDKGTYNDSQLPQRVEAWSNWKNIIIVLRENNCWPSTLYTESHLFNVQNIDHNWTQKLNGNIPNITHSLNFKGCISGRRKIIPDKMFEIYKEIEKPWKVCARVWTAIVELAV
jgi:hypothetical protein